MLIEDYFKTRILNGIIQDFPCNHCFIEQIFPSDFYSKFIEQIPFELFRERGPAKSELELRHCLNQLSEPKKEFWTDFIKWMCSDEIQNTIVNKFKLGIKGNPQLMFSCDKKNYVLGPHIDRKDKLFTSLFYLPKDESNLNLGTVLCTTNDPKPFNWSSFEIVKKIPFKPNSFFCFFGPNSYHGVEKIEEDVERYTMQYLIRS